MKTRLIASLILLLTLSSPLMAQHSLTPLPERVCVNDPSHGRLEVNTVSRTFTASIKGREFSGQLELFEPTPQLEYIMVGATVPDFRFFSNITYKRHASFARVLMDGQGFEMWNREHLDCDGQPTSAPPYEVHIYPRKIEGAAPLTVMLCAAPSDFETLTTYEWRIGGRHAIGNMIPHTFNTPGIYSVSVTATYVDIKAENTITVVVTDPKAGEDDPPPVEVNEPPAVQIEASSLTEKPKKKGLITFTARAEDDDGQIASVVWDFGDGTTGEGESVKKFFRKVGSYTVICRVRDEDGAEASATVTVIVRKK